jgi:LacI family transcriptional regulator
MSGVPGNKSAGSSRRSTVLDVAKRAGVDRSVVSRVLSGDTRLNIRDQTRERVLAAVKELDYTPNPVARSLRMNRAEAMGLLIPDFGNPIYAAIITGAEVAAARAGRVLLTGSFAGGPALGEYIDRLGHGRVDGLLIAGAPTAGDLIADLEKSDIPWLLVNRRAPNSRRHVLLDDEGAAAVAVGHLVELGHQRIAHLAGPKEADTAQRREHGYRKALEKAGLGVESGLIARGDYTAEGGGRAMERLIAGKHPPTAVFVANVAAAIGALAALRAAGVHVPGELSIVAVHDLWLAAYLEPPLTTVRMPLEQLGSRAIEVLASEPADAVVEEVLTAPLKLIARESTGPPG